MEPTTYSTYTTTTDPSGIVGVIMGFFAAYFLVLLLIVVFLLICMWRIFTKAGKPGWAALIPIYNIIVLLEIIEKPVWWILFYLAAIIPFVGYVVVLIGSLLVSLELAKKFGKSPVFGIVGLWLFGIVGYPMLAFGSAEYGGSTSTSDYVPTPQVERMPNTEPPQPSEPIIPSEPTPTVETSTPEVTPTETFVQPPVATPSEPAPTTEAAPEEPPADTNIQ